MDCSAEKAKKIIIAVDGFSSSGKSTFARKIAERLGYIFIDTGAMYRAVTLCAIKHGAIEGGRIDRAKLDALLGRIEMEFRPNALSGDTELYMNGEKVDDRIRSIEVSDLVSGVSALPEVRAKLVALQQRMGRNRGIVMDGRDIGTVVFPDAELKIFLTADPAVRARRRYNELKTKGEDVSPGEIERNIRERDIADRKREISPLRKADDALVLDNSDMTERQQMDWVMGRLKDLGL